MRQKNVPKSHHTNHFELRGLMMPFQFCLSCSFILSCCAKNSTEQVLVRAFVDGLRRIGELLSIVDVDCLTSCIGLELVNDAEAWSILSSTLMREPSGEESRDLLRRLPSGDESRDLLLKETRLT